MALRRGVRWVMGVAFLLGGPPARAEETLDTVEKKIIGLWSRLESMTSTMELKLAGPGGETTSTGTMEYMRKGDKEMYRMDQKYEQEAGGQRLTIVELSVFDGEHLYTLQEFGGQRVAVKRTKDALQGRGGGRLMFDSLRKNYALKLGGDAKVGDQDAWVIEAKPSSGEQAGARLMRLMVAKSTGVTLKVETVDGEGKVQMTANYGDVKVNPKLDAERFTLKALGDVQVMDLTQGEPASPPSAEPK